MPYGTNGHDVVLDGEVKRVARSREPHLANGLPFDLSPHKPYLCLFRAVTALTPLQFQKQLRLQEARSLMLVDDIDVATAAFRVGYESPSQFSREYRRHFGEPPARDIARLRASPS